MAAHSLTGRGHALAFAAAAVLAAGIYLVPPGLATRQCRVGEDDPDVSPERERDRSEPTTLDLKRMGRAQEKRERKAAKRLALANRSVPGKGE